MDELSQISSSADITTANFTVIMALINMLSHFRPIYDVDDILFIIIIVPYGWASSNSPFRISDLKVLATSPMHSILLPIPEKDPFLCCTDTPSYQPPNVTMSHNLFFDS